MLGDGWEPCNHVTSRGSRTYWDALLLQRLSNGFGAESRRGSGLRDKFEGLLKGFSPAAKDLEPARTVHIDDSVSRRFARGADYNLKCASPMSNIRSPTRGTGWLAIRTWQGA